MKKLVLLIAAAVPLLALDVSGNWQGTMVFTNTKYAKAQKEAFSISLKQSGTTLSGSVTRAGKVAAVTSGVESNGTATIVYRVPGETGTLRLTRTGSKFVGAVTTDTGFRADVDLTLKN